MKQVISGLDPADYIKHPLHASERDWPETNCYVDLWIELLASLNLAPEAMLGFTVAQDFEGDHFTFFKTPLEDIERLCGIRVTELAIFDDVERHVLTQISRGRMALVEVDSHWLPDTRGITYRVAHGKTTIAINALDPALRRMHYFHNSGFFSLEGEDYDGIFNRHANAHGQTLFPYAEFVKFPARLQKPSANECFQILESQLARRPLGNPFAEWQVEFSIQFDDLLQRPEAYFHTYAFNTLRQFGANFELLASHLQWLSGNSQIRFCAEIEYAKTISASAKAMQFQLARALAKRKPQAFATQIIPLAEAYDSLMQCLDARVGVRRAA